MYIYRVILNNQYNTLNICNTDGLTLAEKKS